MFPCNTMNYFYIIILSIIFRLSCKSISIFMKINKFIVMLISSDLTTFLIQTYFLFLFYFNFHFRTTWYNPNDSFFNLSITKWTDNFISITMYFFTTIHCMYLSLKFIVFFASLGLFNSSNIS